MGKFFKRLNPLKRKKRTAKAGVKAAQNPTDLQARSQAAAASATGGMA